MLWNELLRKGNYSLLESKSNTQYCVCRNYNPNEKEDQQYDNGIYFCYWGDMQQKLIYLVEALECFRTKTEEEYISRHRLEELATKFKDGLIESDEEFTNEYFEEECDLSESEMEWLGLGTEDYEIGECEEEYVPSATRGDYSPSNPWDAPGMCISDFI